MYNQANDLKRGDTDTVLITFILFFIFCCSLSRMDDFDKPRVTKDVSSEVKNMEPSTN